MTNAENSIYPFVSVVIPAYNAGECIKRAIESVLAQTFCDYEVIVVDDGSTDNTAEAVRKYGPKVRYIHQDNAGVSVARNTAIAAAKGKWIAFLDADDEWLPGKLRRQMELLRRNPDLHWCGANYYRALGPKRASVYNVKAITKALAGRDYIENYFRLAGKMRFGAETQTVIVRKDVFDELGGFEPGRVRAQDLDVWWRIAHKFPKIGYIAEPLAVAHLDVHDPVLTERRIMSKRGKDIRQLMARHLKLATGRAKLDDFKAFASRQMRHRLLTMIYNGLKTDARQTVDQFPELFGLHWRLAMYTLTALPKVTATIGRIFAYLAYVCRLETQVTRRWLYPKTPDKNPEQDE